MGTPRTSRTGVPLAVAWTALASGCEPHTRPIGLADLERSATIDGGAAGVRVGYDRTDCDCLALASDVTATGGGAPMAIERGGWRSTSPWDVARSHARGHDLGALTALGTGFDATSGAAQTRAAPG
jgi:hypothetical protein